MRRIALVSEHASPLAMAGGIDSGGQNIYVAHAAKQLTRMGYEVDVFTRRESGRAPAVLRTQDLYRVVQVPAGPAKVLPKEELLPYMREFADFLVRFASGEERVGRPYDVLHANFFMSGIAGLAVQRALRIPLVMTFHALGKVRRMHQREADRFPDSRFAIEDELVRYADRIVAECEQDSDDLQMLYGADRRRIDVVPCGFDAEEVYAVDRRTARQALGWPQDAFCVLHLGRLVPRKGVDNVIRGVAALRTQLHKESRLYIVGGSSEDPDERLTPEIGRLRQVAQACGVSDLVNFVGRRGREVLRYYYSACDVFVTTPWYEPFGITPVEAMACARPVIGAAVGGIRTTVVDGVTGFLVPPKDPKALAARLAHLMENPAKAESFGFAGRVRSAKLYTWSRVARGLSRVYERAIREVLPVPVQRAAVRPAKVASRIAS